MADKGIHSFIKHKLDNAVDHESIRHSLIRAGFSEASIDAAFENVKKNDAERYQKAAEENDFLPPLKKQHHEVSVPIHSVNQKAEDHKGLFKGRLLRRDFILGFLFFFGLGYLALSAAGVFIAYFFPKLAAALLAAADEDSQGIFLFIIPLVLLPVTIMLFSLIVRRLHNLGIPGGLALVFFGLLIYPAGPFDFYGLWILHFVIIMLFILLLTKKGDPAPNRYGLHPSPKGSFFRRIFNI